MTTTDTQQADELRKQIEAAVKRIEDKAEDMMLAYGENGPTQDQAEDCRFLESDVPALASALLEMVTALENVRGRLDHASAADVTDDTLDDWFGTLTNALAAAAAELEVDDEH